MSELVSMASHEAEANRNSRSFLTGLTGGLAGGLTGGDTGDGGDAVLPSSLFTTASSAVATAAAATAAASDSGQDSQMFWSSIVWLHGGTENQMLRGPNMMLSC